MTEKYKPEFCNSKTPCSYCGSNPDKYGLVKFKCPECFRWGCVDCLPNGYNEPCKDCEKEVNDDKET